MIVLELLTSRGWEPVWYVREPVVVALCWDGCWARGYTETRRYLALDPGKPLFSVLDIGFDGVFVNGRRCPPGEGMLVQLGDVIEFSDHRVRLVWEDPEEIRRRSSAPTAPSAPERVAAPRRRPAKAPAKRPAAKKKPAARKKAAPRKKRAAKDAPEEG